MSRFSYGIFIQKADLNQVFPLLDVTDIVLRYHGDWIVILPEIFYGFHHESKLLSLSTVTPLLLASDAEDHGFSITVMSKKETLFHFELAAESDIWQGVWSEVAIELFGGEGADYVYSRIGTERDVMTQVNEVVQRRMDEGRLYAVHVEQALLGVDDVSLGSFRLLGVSDEVIGDFGQFLRKDYCLGNSERLVSGLLDCLGIFDFPSLDYRAVAAGFDERFEIISV